MTDPLSQTALLCAVHATLRDDLHVRAALGSPARLHDGVPTDPVHPYLRYGRIRTEDRSGDDAPRAVHTLTLHLHSRYGGRAEVMGVLATVLAALSRDALRAHMPGAVSVVSRYADSFTARDGHSRHSLLRLAVTVEPAMEPARMESVQ